MGFKEVLINEEFQNLNLVKIRRIISWGISEMLGTAIFVGLGCASTTPLLHGEQNSHTNTAIAFAFGIALSIMIFGPISYALMNPGLGLIMVILGHLTIVRFLYYCVFECLGAFLGIFTVYVLTPHLGGNFCLTLPNPEVTLVGVFTMEFLTSVILGFAMCHAVDPRQAANHGLLFIKFFVVVLPIAMASAKYSGCSMNPARSFGAAVLAGNWKHHWIYWTATMAGMGFSAVFYQLFFKREIYVDRADSEEK